MKITKIIFYTLLCLILNIRVSAQSFLQDYFQGNKDSLIVSATQLVQMPEPIFQPIISSHIDSATLADMGFEQTYNNENHYFTVRDGKKIFAFKYPSNAPTTIIFLHGVASSAYLYNRTSGLLQEATQAEIYAIDLRGHGKSEGKPGDVEYINQYADDLTDIIQAIRKEKPNGKIILAGHSMGGGVVLRSVMNKGILDVDGILLFAPLIGHNSPAISQGETNAVEDAEPFLKIHIPRIIGLKMLNEIGNHQQDSLPVLFFNLPETIPLRKYSYRANASMTPDDYQEGLQAIKSPLLVLVGSDDEAFNAEILQKAILENSKGEVKIIQNATHNGVRHDAISYEFIKKWFSTI